MSDFATTLSKICAAFNAHDLDEIMGFFADDCVLELPRGTQPWGTRCEGKQAVRSGLATRFEGLPDLHYGNEQHFVDNTASTGISKWLLTGTTPKGVKVKAKDATFTHSTGTER
jgi:ketosteroid isomerase-like protein